MNLVKKNMNYNPPHLGIHSFQHTCGQTFSSAIDLMKRAHYLGSEQIADDYTHEHAVYRCRRCGHIFKLRVPRV